MAGASADSSSFWQIGVNVNKSFEGRHIASGIVSILKADILQKGIVPYYGTSFSNLASQHVAAKAGFEVAWVELITEKTEYRGEIYSSKKIQDCSNTCRRKKNQHSITKMM